MTEKNQFKFDHTNYQKPPSNVPLTAETWLGYWHTEYEGSTDMLTGHVDASNRDIHGLEKILRAAKSFDDLKLQLLQFVQERKDFVKDLDDKWNSDHPEQWGFPPWTP